MLLFLFVIIFLMARIIFCLKLNNITVVLFSVEPSKTSSFHQEWQQPSQPLTVHCMLYIERDFNFYIIFLLILPADIQFTLVLLGLLNTVCKFHSNLTR